LRSSEIYQELRRRILTGELAPGHRLVVRRLSEEFGCSDIPVREALRSLEGDDLIEIAPYRGAQVRIYRPDEVREAYLIRANLEAAATGAAADFVDDETLAQLERLIEVLEVRDLSTGPRIELELALVELDAPRTAAEKRTLERVLASAGGDLLSTDGVWRASLAATPDAIDHALDALRGHGLRSLVRAGAVAMAADPTTTPPTENGATQA
jgi:DNA-binding transcriptional regulator YhcF (GntR family)